jgi:hypothetical protein
MRAQLVAVGAVILIVGIAIAAYGLATPVTQTTSTTTTSTGAVVRDTGRTVTANGFWAMGAANLANGEKITGTVTVDNFSSSKGPMFIYVQNESSFIAWGGCAPCGATNELNASLPTSGSYSISWTAPKAGSYYFVLDASYYGAAAPSHFSATGVTSTNTQTTQTNPNTTLNYGGFVVAILGSLVLAAGLVLGPAAKKQTSP